MFAKYVPARPHSFYFYSKVQAHKHLFRVRKDHVPVLVTTKKTPEIVRPLGSLAVITPAPSPSLPVVKVCYSLVQNVKLGPIGLQKKFKRISRQNAT